MKRLNPFMMNLSELWKTVTLNYDPEITTCSFFEIYDKYLDGEGPDD